MGLAGTKRRTKLSHDPNNTAWSKSTDSFGQKILASQGWKPGDYLGARNASHADHYTAANATYIRPVLREENLGLGATIAKGNAETFGLSMLSGLFGRLNGKDEAVLAKQEQAMRDVELSMYHTTKYGRLNFVRGGTLMGDKIVDINNAGVTGSAGGSLEPKKDLKRKATAVEDSKHDEPVSKRKKARRSESKEKDDGDRELQPVTEISKEERQQEKVRRKMEKETEAAADEEARLKQEKRARKEERRKRKEEKRRKRAEKEAANFQSSDQNSTAPTTSASEDSAMPPHVVKEVPPSLSRHAVRQRYIQQKRMASMNPQALKEIFMLKATS